MQKVGQQEQKVGHSNRQTFFESIVLDVPKDIQMTKKHYFLEFVKIKCLKKIGIMKDEIPLHLLRQPQLPLWYVIFMVENYRE